MTYLTTVTSKGQVTIPKPIRDRLKISPSTKVIFQLHQDHAIIQPVKDFLSLKGSIKPTRPFSDKAANKAILSAIKKDYAQKNH